MKSGSDRLMISVNGGLRRSRRWSTGNRVGSQPPRSCLAVLMILACLLAVAPFPAAAFGQGSPDPGHLGTLLPDRLPGKPDEQQAIRKDLTALMLGYARHIAGIEVDAAEKVFLITKNRTRIEYDDGRPKTFEERLANPDLQDTLSQIYTPGEIDGAIPEGHDPGRFRVQGLFEAVYGSSHKEVKANLVQVAFCGRQVAFNSRNGASKALERVGRELASLIKEKPALSKYVLPPAGTYNRRHIAGTSRLSPHAFGIAIDLNPRFGAYWRNHGNQTDTLTLRREYPAAIVDIFEKHGFIWGGKWDHFDLMHFEYRPELLAKAKLMNAGSQRP
ncbi:MAG: M15 family metallopeptidase [Thermodesulfobacteriota bacterium]